MIMQMNEWIAHSPLMGGALAANVTLYKWLLGGGIILMALLGLVFFGMLALSVLNQQDTPPAGEEPLPEEPAPQPEALQTDEADAAAVEDQEGASQ